MNGGFLYCLKCKQDISIWPISSGVKTAFRWTPTLRGNQCQEDFAQCWSKMLIYLRKNPAKLLFEHWEKNRYELISLRKINYNHFLSQTSQEELEQIGQVLHVAIAIHFHLRAICGQKWMILVSEPSRVIFDKIEPFLNAPININRFFTLFKVTLRIGDTAPLIFSVCCRSVLYIARLAELRASWEKSEESTKLLRAVQDEECKG